MDGNTEKTPGSPAVPIEFQRAGLLADIRSETKHMRTAKFTLEFRLLEAHRLYTDDLTGKSITLPPGALFDARSKMILNHKYIEHDTLTDILRDTFARAGITDAQIVATTVGAWVGNDTLDKLLAWSHEQQSDALHTHPRVGANRFAHLFTTELNNRGNAIWR